MVFFKKNFILLIIILFFFIFSSKIFAELRLNEIYPAPPSGEYEWVELYNDEDKIIDTSQYQVLDLAGNKLKISAYSALPFTFILATSSSVLNNNGDIVYLYKCPESILIDTISYPSNIKNDLSFGRFPDGKENWALCPPTREASNLSCVITPTPTLNPTITPYIFICPTSTPTSTPSPSPTQTPTISQSPTPTISPTSYSSPTPNPTPTPTFALVSYQNIYLSEIYPNPQTGENEWVEIYNDNDFAVELINWYIDDVEDSGASPKKFSLTIEPKSYAVIEFSSAIFNNDSDSVRLLDFEKKEKDSLEYKDSQKGKSFGRISFETDEFCLQEPSKNQKNNPCLNNLQNFNLNPTISPNSFNSNYENNSQYYQSPILLKKISPIFYFKSIDQALSDQFFISNTKDINQKENEEEILGVYHEKRSSKIGYLNLISFSYALLSALGIAIKNMKFPKIL